MDEFAFRLSCLRTQCKAQRVRRRHKVPRRCDLADGTRHCGQAPVLAGPGAVAGPNARFPVVREDNAATASVRFPPFIPDVVLLIRSS